jgi:hypothetical protein
VENRVIRYFTGLEALLARDTPVGPDHPLTLWIGREILIEVLEDNLANIARNRVPLLETPEEREQIDRIAADRRAFLSWVRAWDGVNLFVGLFPCTEFEPDEDLPNAPEVSDDDSDCSTDPGRR